MFCKGKLLILSTFTCTILTLLLLSFLFSPWIPSTWKTSIVLIISLFSPNLFQNVADLWSLIPFLLHFYNCSFLCLSMTVAVLLQYSQLSLPFSACLRSWLEQDTSCPTCRMTLSERPENWSPTADNRGAPPNPNMADAGPNIPPGTTNHFFHFDGTFSFLSHVHLRSAAEVFCKVFISFSWKILTTYEIN